MPVNLKPKRVSLVFVEEKRRLKVISIPATQNLSMTGVGVTGIVCTAEKE